MVHDAHARTRTHTHTQRKLTFGVREELNWFCNRNEVTDDCDEV